MKICLEDRLAVLSKFHLQRIFSLLTQKSESSPHLSSVVWLNARWEELVLSGGLPWHELPIFSGLKYLWRIDRLS